MGKNIKFFKKLTSLVLAGLTIFSSVPAKAWKEEDPRDAAESEVYNMLSQGYKNIFCGDYNNCEIGINMDTRNTSELSSLGYVVKHPFWFCGTVMKGLFSSEGILLSIDSAYYTELLNIIKIIKMMNIIFIKN